MRVPPLAPSAAGPSTTATAPKTAVQVAARRTPLDPPQIRTALARAHERLAGRPASRALLDVLTAQVAHETARGQSMYNYNFGGIKGAGTHGETARCRTREVLGGTEKVVVDGFRAYRSAEEGAVDYLAFLQHRYGSALEAAERGDVTSYAAELKRKGYYTASVESYTAALRALVGDERPGARVVPGAPHPGADFVGDRTVEGGVARLPVSFPTETTVARVLAGLDEQVARALAPVDDAVADTNRNRDESEAQGGLGPTVVGV